MDNERNKRNNKLCTVLLDPKKKLQRTGELASFMVDNNIGSLCTLRKELENNSEYFSETVMVNAYIASGQAHMIPNDLRFIAFAEAGVILFKKNKNVFNLFKNFILGRNIKNRFMFMQPQYTFIEG
jgi:hypothetical protein